MYKRQHDEERLNGVIENILLLYEQHEKEMAEVSKMPQKLVHYEDVKDNILFKLINTEYNQELLMQVPHIPYLDLSIVFYIYVSESEQGIMATLVHNEHIESWNVTVDELYEAARKNTPERMPARFCSIVEPVSYTHLKPQWSQGVYQSIIICPGGNVQRCMPLPCVH